MSKFLIGDQVKIVNYGGMIWESKKSNFKFSSYPIIKEEESYIVRDSSPEMIGKIGIVTKVNPKGDRYGESSYALEIPGKVAWYNDDQLELILRPNYECR